jgi:ParB/Sulfiredoxin domain
VAKWRKHESISRVLAREGKGLQRESPKGCCQSQPWDSTDHPSALGKCGSDPCEDLPGQIDPRFPMNIELIQVGFRYRKDLGDLKTLAQSIEEVGLLHPVVVIPEGRLIAGQRRLEACRLLGWTDIAVTVVDLYQAARGEAHENFVRKDLLPSEIVALKRAIEPLERREARQRQGGRVDLCHPATLAECQRTDPCDARDKISRYLGVGRTTIEPAEAVVQAAEEEPEEYPHLVDQMDRSGKVAGAPIGVWRF